MEKKEGKYKKTSNSKSKRNRRTASTIGKRRLIELILLLTFGLILLFSVLKMGGKASVPYSYDTLIEKYSKENGLKKELVAAVIYQESRFDPNVASHRGAKGLMQIMPETGEWVSLKMGLDYTEDMLLDPETNVKMGTWYLKYLLDYYEGDERLALAAYNAGFGNVDQWMEDDSLYYGDYLHNIPFSETENYVETIEKMEKIYKDMYPDAFKNAVVPSTFGGE